MGGFAELKTVTGGGGVGVTSHCDNLLTRSHRINIPRFESHEFDSRNEHAIHRGRASVVFHPAPFSLHFPPFSASLFPLQDASPREAVPAIARLSLVRSGSHQSACVLCMDMQLLSLSSQRL
jgi:hypothetical protein